MDKEFICKTGRVEIEDRGIRSVPEIHQPEKEKAMMCKNCGGLGYVEYANGRDDFDRVPCENCGVTDSYWEGIAKGEIDG